MFLYKKNKILNIQNNDERCFGYALLYFLERERLPERHYYQASLNKKNTMFQRHHLETLLYPISLNDVHLYENQL